VEKHGAQNFGAGTEIQGRNEEHCSDKYAKTDSSIEIKQNSYNHGGYRPPHLIIKIKFSLWHTNPRLKNTK
jgi:hypothetical protein